VYAHLLDILDTSPAAQPVLREAVA
jgi:hypothetical protein